MARYLAQRFFNNQAREVERLSDLATTEDLVHCPVHGWVRPDVNHVNPGSRGGSAKSRHNLNRRTCPICHKYYHWIFSNLTPSEIIGYLVERFWNGQVRWVFIFFGRYLLKKVRKSDEWPEGKANWSAHLEESWLHQTSEDALRVREVMRELGQKALEGELQIREVIRKLGLKPGDLYLVNEETKEVILWGRMNGGKTQQELLEEILAGRELGPNESIRPVIWRMRRSDSALGLTN